MGAGDGSIAGCDATGGKNGIFQYAARGSCTTTGLDPGATFISDVDGVKNYTGNREDVFGCIAALGESGCGFEHPFASITRALGADGSPAPAENQGFLRPEAFLFIVIVTDEDDCSAPPVRRCSTPRRTRPSNRRWARPATSAATSSATSATAPGRRGCRRAGAPATS